ncbi:MAG TPA: hypothetical protein VGW78_06870 [Candidatus Babeliales bacterium]|jgi:hypothetical protein|nr:hypothetical protein [Candidatus Babeliales bacterium]
MNIKNTTISFLLIFLCNNTIYSLRPEEETPERLLLLGQKLGRIIQRKEGDEEYNQKQREIEAQISEYLTQCQMPYDAISRCITNKENYPTYYNYLFPKKSPKSGPNDIERAKLCKFLKKKLIKHGQDLGQGTRWSPPRQQGTPAHIAHDFCNPLYYWTTNPK